MRVFSPYITLGSIPQPLLVQCLSPFVEPGVPFHSIISLWSNLYCTSFVSMIYHILFHLILSCSTIIIPFCATISPLQFPHISPSVPPYIPFFSTLYSFLVYDISLPFHHVSSQLHRIPFTPYISLSVPSYVPYCSTTICPIFSHHNINCC